MAEAERIIGTPDIPDAEGADGAGAPAARRGHGPGRERRPVGRGRKKILVLLGVAVLAYLLDLISKMIVVAKLEHQEPIEIIGDWLSSTRSATPVPPSGSARRSP